MSGSTEPASVTYDAAYRLSSLTDGNGHTTLYSYDGYGYLAAVSYPGAGGATTGPDTINFTAYDPDGNLTQRVDGNGAVTNFKYTDVASALTDVQYPAAPGLNVHLGYDAYGRPAPASAPVTDGAGVRAYAYDDTDGLTGVQTTYGTLPARTLSYGYYPDGSRQGMATPGGSFTYQYDAGGRMTGLTNPSGETTAWQYQPNDWLQAQTLANGVATSYALNAAGELTGLTNQRGTTLLSSFGSMGYDGVGNRAAVTAALPAAPSGYGGTTGYIYDAQNRLTQEQSTRAGNYTNTFAYDQASPGGAGSLTGAGNPTTLRGAWQGFNADNQLQGNGFHYDGDGNPYLYKGTALAFDANGQMTAYGSTVSCGYTSDGLRAWKGDGSGNPQTYYLYDGTSPVCELDNQGNVTAVNTFGGSGLVSRHTGAGSVFYTFDERGNVAQRLSGSGAVLSSDLYDGFGARQTTDATGDPFGFAGQMGCQTDGATGLVLMTHRFYDPATGRFLTRDPVDYAGGINLYGYTRNNPVVLSDPTGNSSILQIIGNGLAGIGIGGVAAGGLGTIYNIINNGPNGGFWNGLFGVGSALVLGGGGVGVVDVGISTIRYGSALSEIGAGIGGTTVAAGGATVVFAGGVAIAGSILGVAFGGWQIGTWLGNAPLPWYGGLSTIDIQADYWGGVFGPDTAGLDQPIRIRRRIRRHTCP